MHLCLIETVAEIVAESETQKQSIVVTYLLQLR